MKKFTLIWLLMLLSLLTTQAQSFRLWYANNVTDVADFSKIEDAGSGLIWREVQTSAQTVAGNLVEVNKLKPPAVAVKLPFSNSVNLLVVVLITPIDDIGIKPLPPQVFVLVG